MAIRQILRRTNSTSASSIMASFMVAAAMVGAVGGCQTLQSGATSSTVIAANSGVGALAGRWEMDLSPVQDRSYLKEFFVVPDADKPGKVTRTFIGTVYGGSPFDNGQVMSIDTGVAFAFVSDEKGEQGGPYYWIGQKVTRPGNLSVQEVLTGRVRSLTRNFELAWSATRVTK